MKVISVIPIKKGIFKDALSYFTSLEINLGALVSVSVRNKAVPAVVSEIMEVQKMKTDLKKIPFSLKPLKAVRSSNFLRPEFILACKKAGEYFLAPVGTVIKEFIPQAILEKDFKYPPYPLPQKNKDAWSNIELIQAEDSERMQNYRSIIREEFAKGRSVFVCMPSVAEISQYASELEKGIEKYSIILHAGMAKKKICEAWGGAVSEKHPLLVIATKAFLSLPRPDWGAIIVDREGSPLYKGMARPYVDARKMAEFSAKEMGIKLVLGDNLIRAETYAQNRFPATHRFLSGAEQEIIDMSSKKDADWQKRDSFRIISEPLYRLIEENISQSGHMLIFANRRGFSSTTICNDCLRTILCSKCETPMVLHKENAPERHVKMICHKCLKEEIVPERCPYCQSWRLESLGIGIQRVEEEVLKIFPQAKIFRLDSDVIKSQDKAKEIIDKFLSTPGGILLATEIVLFHLFFQVERVAIASIDGMFSIPDFRINEKAFQTLIRLRSLAKEDFLIQTRLPDNEVFGDVLRGNSSGFYRRELEEREKFSFPPYKVLILITKENKNLSLLKNEINALEERLKKWAVSSYPAFIPKIKRLYSWHLLIKIDPERWPGQETELAGVLASLPPSYKINVDPDSLL